MKQELKTYYITFSPETSFLWVELTKTKASPVAKITATCSDIAHICSTNLVEDRTHIRQVWEALEEEEELMELIEVVDIDDISDPFRSDLNNLPVKQVKPLGLEVHGFIRRTSSCATTCLAENITDDNFPFRLVSIDSNYRSVMTLLGTIYAKSLNLSFGVLSIVPVYDPKIIVEMLEEEYPYTAFRMLGTYQELLEFTQEIFKWKDDENVNELANALVFCPNNINCMLLLKGYWQEGIKIGGQK